MKKFCKGIRAVDHFFQGVHAIGDGSLYTEQIPEPLVTRRNGSCGNLPSALQLAK